MRFGPINIERKVVDTKMSPVTDPNERQSLREIYDDCIRLGCDSVAESIRSQLEIGRLETTSKLVISWRRRF